MNHLDRFNNKLKLIILVKIAHFILDSNCRSFHSAASCNTCFSIVSIEVNMRMQRRFLRFDDVFRQRNAYPYTVRLCPGARHSAIYSDEKNHRSVADLKSESISDFSEVSPCFAKRNLNLGAPGLLPVSPTKTRPNPEHNSQFSNPEILSR